MAYFAKIDENNIVTEVIVADQAFIDSGVVGDSSLYIETWVDQKDNPRKNYAGIGYTYDQVRNAFIQAKPDPSSGGQELLASSGDYTLNEDTCQWDSPIPYPDDGKDNGDGKWDHINYKWNITDQTWVLATDGDEAWR